MLIEDGKGGQGGNWQMQKNRGQVDAQIRSEMEHHSRKGLSFSWTNVTYNADLADTIIAIRNTSSTKNLHITKVFLSCDVVQVAEHHVTQGSAALAGTLITGVNLGNSGLVAEADARGDETTNTAQGDIVLKTEMLAATQFVMDWDGVLILGTNDSYAIDFPTEPAIVHATVWGYFEDKP